VAHELHLIVRAFAARGVGLDVLIYHLVGIEIGAVAGKKEKAVEWGFLPTNSLAKFNLNPAVGRGCRVQLL